MRYLKITNYSFTFVLIALLLACSGSGKKTQSKIEVSDQTKTIKVNDESQALLDYLVELGDYVNSRNFPSLIKASSVYKELANNILIVDLRSNEEFTKGHIKGAINVAFEELPDYMSNTIKPFEFERIVLVCYAGQIASYATSLLRLTGYGNVYSLRWGMSGWNKHFATDWWLDAISSNSEKTLETTTYEKAQAIDFPKMNSGKLSGEEIHAKRVKAIFEAGYNEAMISCEEVFETPENYYIINYDRRDKYESGHIRGAVRYKPNATLGIKSEMQTIPTEKEVVVYCGTGHNSGFVTAYLRLFGYNAKTLMYGNNSFMYNKMVSDKKTLSWLPFTETEINNFPFVTN